MSHEFLGAMKPLSASTRIPHHPAYVEDGNLLGDLARQWCNHACYKLLGTGDVRPMRNLSTVFNVLLGRHVQLQLQLYTKHC